MTSEAVVSKGLNTLGCAQPGDILGKKGQTDKRAECEREFIRQKTPTVPKEGRVGPYRPRLAETSSPGLGLWAGNCPSERNEQILTAVVCSL